MIITGDQALIKYSGQPVRTRFAPSPSGQIHLGNLRAALINYIWAKHHNGTFILRIEDTDKSTAKEAHVESLLKALSKFGLTYDEGPAKGGPFAPYFQSERTAVYSEAFQSLLAIDHAYRCFCTHEELERERQLAIAARRTPRYSRRCASLKPVTVDQKVQAGFTFVWRLRLNHLQQVKINDLCKGEVTFGLSNFSDPALTRSDGSFTFLFANFVDDLQQQVSHVFRGEDHLSNTAIQMFLFSAFKAKAPQYGHLPMILNADGQKLSKREQHASAESLLADGFLGSAILDYLMRLGCFDHNGPRDTKTIAKNFKLEFISASSTLRFDPEQLAWINKEHIKHSDPSLLLKAIKDNLEDKSAFLGLHPEERTLDLINLCRDEVSTMLELADLLETILCKPGASPSQIQQALPGLDTEKIAKLILETNSDIKPEEFLAKIKSSGVQPGLIFKLIRLLLTGQATGLGIEKLFKIYGLASIKSRFSALLSS